MQTRPALPDEELIERVRRPLLIRIGAVMSGTVLVLAGIIGLLLPVVPGWLLIIAGLAILATEFVWARRLLDTAKARASDIKAKVVKPGTKKRGAAA
ncbi:MAG TPA: PGPGW domain-containing protein [Acidimicrobiia bacterium]|nr:PGPGW domain-containing protein [Acidimicrobiia bacterium]